MVEHLKIDGVSLQAAKGQIALARSDFSNGNVQTDQVAESVGHKELGDSIRKMGADWGVKREKLSLKLANLEANLEASIRTFGDWDNAVAESFSAPRTGAAPAAQGPVQQSAGAGQTPAASGPVGPHVGAETSAVASAPPGQGQDLPDTADTDAAEPSPRLPVTGGVPVSAHTPDALTDVIDRLSRSTQGWESMPAAEQALLFTAIGTAGLTLLVRAGKLPGSVLDLDGAPVTATGPVTPTSPVPGKPPAATAEPTAPEGAPTPDEGVGVPAEDASPSEEAPVVPGTTPAHASPEDANRTDAAVTEAPPASAQGSEDTAAAEDAPPAQGETDATAALPEIPNFAADEQESSPGGGAGGGSGGSSAGPSGDSAGLQTAGLQPVPSLSELMDGPSGSSTPETTGPIDLPPLAASLGSGPPGLGGEVSAGTGMSAGMGMASMAHTLGGAANTASSGVAAKTVQEEKIRDAVKALSDLRDEQKEDRK